MNTNEELSCAACGQPTRDRNVLCDSCQEAEDRRRQEAGEIEPGPRDHR